MQDVITSDTEIVAALRSALAERVGRQRFDVWFGSGVRLTLRDGTIVVVAPNAFYQEFLRHNFRREIEACGAQQLGYAAPVEFRVEDPQPAADGPPRGVEVAGPSRDVDAAASATFEAPGQPPAVAHSPSPRRFAGLRTFVVGPSNRLALTSAAMVADRPGELSPLYLHGPPGVGKTHLLEGIWTAVKTRRRDTSVVYLSAEQFTTYFLEALHGSGLPSFRRKYRNVGVLIIDDLQFLRGKAHTAAELVHTIDTLHRAGRQLVFSGDAAPAELSHLGPELVTRLQGGMVCRVAPPEYETRLGIVDRLAARSKRPIPPGVRQYVATHLAGDARLLAGALHRLEATSQALDQPLTMALAQEALAEMVRHSAPVVRLTDIERAVCETFGLPPESLQSDRKTRGVSHPRMLAMWLARKHTRAALAEIGSYFGRRSHSTVVSAQKKINGWVADRARLQLADRPWAIDEAIRSVEEKLRTG